MHAKCHGDYYTLTGDAPHSRVATTTVRQRAVGGMATALGEMRKRLCPDGRSIVLCPPLFLCRSLCQEGPLEYEMAAHCSILA